MSLRAGNGPRGMTEKLLGCRFEELTDSARVSPCADHIVLSGLGANGPEALEAFERAPGIDLAIAYEPNCLRNDERSLSEPRWTEALRRVGVLRGRPGIGFPASVHLERFGAPGRTLVGDDPRLYLLGGVGMLPLVVSTEQALRVLGGEPLSFATPRIMQILLSGKLNPSVAARDVALSLLRMNLRERTETLAKASGCPVVLEFTGPGLRNLSVQERALLCSLAPEVGAWSAVAGSDEKTELYLRDQRRSKAHRQLSPDAGAGCADVMRLELGGVEPLVQLADGTIAALGEREFQPVREIVLGGEVSGTLRDVLSAAQWFKSKRAQPDIDLVIVPATRQTLEAMTSDGTLALLLSAGARLLPPDARWFTAEWQPPPNVGQSVRSFTPSPHAARAGAAWAVASTETLCQAAIAGRLQDPRLLRRATKVPCPRELPIDDTWLFDRKPSLLPPPLPRGPQLVSDTAASEWLETPASQSAQ
ncbi:MAG: aconitase family protein [Polyangiaceae bacterium]